MTKEENKQLCEEYPFLKCNYNLISGKEIEDYDYSWTWADDLNTGWRKAFGNKIWDELKEILIKGNYLYDFRFTEIKEKYGTLRLYYGSYPAEIEQELSDWTSKWEDMSMVYCYRCGNPTKYLSGYYYLCEECYKRGTRLNPSFIPSTMKYKADGKTYHKRESLVADLMRKVWSDNEK